MKRKYALSFCLVLTTLSLMACGGSNYNVNYAPHPSGKGIREIDELVVQEKRVYLQNCYSAVSQRMVPNNQCQSKLFEVVERRNGTKFNRQQLNTAAEEIFFEQVIKSKMEQIITTNPNVRQQLKGRFQSKDELFGYYRTAELIPSGTSTEKRLPCGGVFLFCVRTLLFVKRSIQSFSYQSNRGRIVGTLIPAPPELEELALVSSLVKTMMSKQTHPAHFWDRT
jgi:hypothetical protein